MKTILSILFIAVIGNTAYAQDPDAGESIKYVKVASSNPDAVVQDGTDFFESESLGTLLQNQQVTMLDSTDGEYVKIRAVIGGKKVEGWVKKTILQTKPVENIPRITEASAVDGNSAPYAAPGTVSPGIIEPPWDQIDLTGKEMKPFYVPIVPVTSSSPLVPILVGTIGVATLAYVILSDDKGPDDCSFTASAQASPSSCSLPNGSIVVTVNSTAAVEYLWSTGSTTKDLLQVAAGNYTVTITRTGTTCTQVLSATVNNVDQPITTDITTQDADCGMQNGSVIISVSPPAFYTYAWSNGPTTQNQTQLSPGVYGLTVSSAGTCMESYSVTINELPPSFEITLQSTPSNCGLADGTATATINPSVEYTLNWSDGQTGSQASNLSSGSYTITVTIPGTNCSKEANVTVEELPAAFTLTVSSTPSGCGVSDGTATVTPDPPGAYTFAWPDGQSGAQASGLVAGSYNVTVSITGTTCSKETNVTIDELPAAFNVTISSTPSSCGIADGTATATVDLPGEYTIAWSTGQSGAQVSGLAAGSYNVTVTLTGTTCSQEANVSITELPPGFTVAVSSTPSGCGLSDGTATVTADPPGPYSFQWSTGETTAQATGLVAGSYNVTVSITGTTCTQQASVNVEELPAGFTVTVSSTPSACGMSDGTATAVADPPAEYLFAWSTGQNIAQASGLAPGTYTVTVTIPGSSCSQESSITVEELPPAFTLTFTTTPAGCGLTNGSATVIVDPAGSYMYQWSTGPTDPQISNVAAGQYTVTVTTAGTMCSNSASVNVEQAGGGFTATFTTDNADCGLSNGSATITPDPPAEYTMVWSDQQTGPMLQNAAAGTYTVTVTDANSCSEEFSVTVSQDPAEYISVVNTMPGNCMGGGEISFMLTTPGAGPLNVAIVGPQGSTPLSLPAGTYLLSSFMSVLPGAYTITVYDEPIGPACLETIMATVQDNTPLLTTEDDFYSTPGGQPVTENALDNDSGLGIEMTEINNEIGGTVTFTASGDFTFFPDQGFSGDASFTYTVTDDCGTTSTAIVNIFVEVTICDFEVEFETTAASCGLDDGEITADVLDAGSYDFEWNTGDNGPTISNIFAGTYTVTITDLNLGCNLVFSVDLPENPADYISDVVITQPECGAPGEIQFTAISPSGNDLNMSVDHPNGSDNFTISEGIIRISDYVSITPGDYIIEVTDPDAGPDCFENFAATLVASPSLQIIVQSIIPPSSPPAMDGVIGIVTTVTGELPYTVFLNGIPIFTINQHNFLIEGVGVGLYTVQIIDASGCESNILMVDVPLPDIILSFGTGLINSSNHVINEQPVSSTPSSQWSNALLATLEYNVGRVRQELRMVYAIPHEFRNHFYQKGFLELEYLSSIKHMNWKRLRMNLQGGIGIRSLSSNYINIKPQQDPQYLSLRTSLGYTLAGFIKMQSSLSLRGWHRLEKPVFEFSFTIPVNRIQKLTIKK